ncbi:MAG: hypothetical protein PHP42_03005 [Bacteroidota bacterium]|nr:hypothetical protein [Bacteroidota bacterium]
METLQHTYQVVQRGMENPPAKIGLLYGAHGVYQTATLLMAEVVKRNGTVAVVDGANRIDPYYLPKIAQLHALNAEEFLQHAYVSRAFTFYQIDVSLTDGLLEFMQSINSKVLLVYGLLDLIDDEQVAIPDIHDILQRITVMFAQLKAKGISILLVSTPLRFELYEREKYFSELEKMSDIVYRLDHHHQNYFTITIEEGENHGTLNPHSNNDHRSGKSTLVELPTGAQKRGTRYAR